LGRNAAAEANATARTRPAAGAGNSEPAPAAANLELGPGRPVDGEVPAEQFRVRQENVLRMDTRITALEDAGRLLAGARGGGEAGLKALADRGPELAGRLQAGGNLGEVLGGGAGAAGPDKLRDAEIEAAGSLLLTRQEAATERQALDRDMVAAENQAASRIDLGRVERAAAPLRGQGVPEDLAALSDALKASPMSRGRVLDLLAGGAR
jgi:hypothetical protein